MAARVGVRSGDDLTGPRLVAFRAEIIKEPFRANAKGNRGAKRTTDRKRSAHTINSDLRNVRTVLGYLRKLGLLSRISYDDLKDGLERLPAPTKRIDYRKPHELQQLLDACLRHDGKTWDETREEHAGLREKGTTLRHPAVAHFFAFVLLTGMRAGEAINLDWSQVDLEALDHEGRVVGEIHLTEQTKTHRARTVGLEVSPALRKLLAALKLSTGGKDRVFALTMYEAKRAERRLRTEFSAPAGCGCQALRRTCGTYLTNAPGIFGSASAYRSAKQLGHSVLVAEKFYVDVARGIRRTARSLEAAMQIEEQMKKVIASVTSGRVARKAG